MALSPAELAQLVASAIRDVPVPGSAGSSWETAYAVARAESGGRPEAVGDGGQSFGLWQIYLPAHPQYSSGWLVDPRNNAQAMAAISSGGNNWNPWCTWEGSACGGYGRASYRAYVAEAQAAFASLRAQAPAPPPPPPPPPAPAPSSPWGAVLLVAGGAAIVYAARSGRF